MIIYRVENEHGEGPFKNRDRFGLIVAEVRPHLLRHRNPFAPGEPWHGLPKMDPDHVCGLTAKQLRDSLWGMWDFVWLAEHGYHLYLYNVPGKMIRKGDTQITFPRSGNWKKIRISYEQVGMVQAP